ncbi:SulP family inorganic anion transporter [Leisingera sp. ANG-M1]|uniref:SulP family inorganic anion transporter n=1 Tax=Leisingera sp. ANG-M1 TaxID=1577895 RepID=UPI001F4CE510|nr:SulP family inorganic anion transporter [Leisingera sp. ANG-M1]
MSDAVAGFTNAAIVLPQGVAFAVIAGLPPQYGLFTAMITPVIAAIWGSSMIMVSGPTTAISAVLLATLSGAFPPGTPEYISAALVLTIMVGMFQICAGLMRLGVVISFISHSVMVGFTAAAALLIGTSQIGNMLGIQIAGGAGPLGKLVEAVHLRSDVNMMAVFLAAFTFASIFVFSKISRKLPAYFLALLFGSVLGWVLNAGSFGIRMFDELPSIAPALSVPSINLSLISDLSPGAATVAFIGLLEAVSIGRAFAIRRKEKYDANQEIVGQGLSNFAAGFFQAYAGSGSFTRSALNADSGAKSPMSAVFAAIFLFLLLLLLSPFVTYVPVPVMAGIIIYVAVKLVNADEIKHIIYNSPSDTFILILTFLTGVLTHLDTAVVAGVIASLVVFLRQSSAPFLAALAPAMDSGKRSLRNARLYGLPECPQIRVQRMEGPLFFGSVEQLEAEFEKVDEFAPAQKIKVFSLKGVGRLDLSGADFLIRQIQAARQSGGDFHVVAMYTKVLRALRRMHVIDELGEKHLHITKGHAISAAVHQADPAICAKCKLRVFDECRKKPAPEGYSGNCTPTAITVIDF